MNKYISGTDYKNSYKREIPAFAAGIIILVVTAMFLFSGALSSETYEDTEQWLKITSWLSILSLIVRLFAANWVSRIARRQNRHSVRWSWIAFILPGITLCIIGLLGKKELTLEVGENLSPKKQSSILRVRANELYLARNFPLAIQFAGKSLEIDPANNKSREIRALAYFYSNLYEESLNDFVKLRDSGYRPGKVYYYLGNIELKKGEFEKASDNWLRAKSKGYGSAKFQLNRYWNYRGKFLLTKGDVKRKLYKHSGRGADLKSINYKNGIEDIDNFLKRGDVKIRTTINDHGLIIRFRKFPKTLYLGVHYIEIEDMSVNKSKQQIYLKLLGKSRIWLNYYPGMDRREELETLKQYYSAAKDK